ncbi:MAG: hypothetical protein V4729_10940 [Pseudomonadota bacterium]
MNDWLRKKNMPLIFFAAGLTTAAAARLPGATAHRRKRELA